MVAKFSKNFVQVQGIELVKKERKKFQVERATDYATTADESVKADLRVLARASARAKLRVEDPQTLIAYCTKLRRSWQKLFTER